ncbi:MAG: hypothetical protein AB7E80_09350 [Hyphomicrobiaceae bacterium]
MSILKRYGIERTRENIRAVEAIVRDVPPLKDDVPEVVQRRLEALGKALIRADLSFKGSLGHWEDGLQIRIPRFDSGRGLQSLRPPPVTPPRPCAVDHRTFLRYGVGAAPDRLL